MCSSLSVLHSSGIGEAGFRFARCFSDGAFIVSAEIADVFEAAVLFAQKETILPAPESAHAIRAAIDEALRCKESGEEKTILFGLTGTGYFDLNAYTAYKNGTMTNYIPSDEELARCAAALPQIEEDAPQIAAALSRAV